MMAGLGVMISRIDVVILFSPFKDSCLKTLELQQVFQCLRIIFAMALKENLWADWAGAGDTLSPI
jgi:hypothetical protein